MINKYLKRELPYCSVLPAIIWQITFLLIPFGFVVLISFLKKFGFFQSLDFSFSVSNYTRMLHFNYFKAIYNSLFLGFLTSFVCLIFSVPLALILIFRIKKKLRSLLLLFLIVPSWTNFIIRIYAWFFILKKDGLFAWLFFKFGLISAHSALLSNYFSVLLGMVYCYFPFMLVPIYVSLNNLDKSLVEAATDLGSTKVQIFFHVILPYINQACTIGFLIVALSSFGEFAVQDFLGGAKDLYWGNLIANKFLILCNYGSGAALVVIGLLSLAVFLVFSYFFTKLFFSGLLILQKILNIANGLWNEYL